MQPDPAPAPASGDDLRVRLWQVAAGWHPSEEALIQELLDLVGPALGVARVGFYRADGDQLVAAVEWRRPDRPPLIGLRVPIAAYQRYVDADEGEVRPAALFASLPAALQEAAGAPLREAVTNLGITSTVGEPLTIDGQLVGVVTFHHVDPVSPGWSQSGQAIRSDLAQILAQSLARRRTEAARQASDAAFRTLFELAADAIFIVGRDGRVLDVNAAACRQLDYERDVLLRMRVEDFAIEPWRDSRLRDLGQLRAVVLDSTHIRRDGTRLEVEVSFAPLRFQGKGAACCIARDITERRRAEQALRDSEQRFRELAELLPQAVYECDAAGRFTYLNRSGLELLGLEGAELPPGFTIRDIVPPDGVLQIDNNLGEVLAGKATPRIGREYRIRARDGRIVDLATYSSPIVREGRVVGVRGVGIDMTEANRAASERQRLEAKMLQAQQLESLGLLAGGIAHDFNNLLFSILGNADLALAAASKPEEVTRRLQQIQRGARRAAELANQMLAYSGRGHALVAPLDLSALVVEMGGLLESAVAHPGALRLELAPNLPAVDADATQVRQVVMNLILNAAEALPDAAGRITVRTGVADVTPETLCDAWGAEALVSGRCAFVEVSDTGCGMDPATRARIFDPFFTTKFTGRGLGLAAVLGIVRQHRGAVTVASRPGAGSTFTVLFPVAPPRDGVGAAAPVEAAAWRGSGTVLVVDDEADIREVASEMLAGLGFTVLTAASAPEALALVAAHAAELRAVLLDVTMPTMSGVEAVPRLRALAPALPIVVASGYGEGAVPVQLAAAPHTAVLQKPFGLDVLQRALRGVLGD